MSWRRRIGSAVGIGAIGLVTAALASPARVLGSLPPAAEEALTQHPVQPATVVLLAAYAGWMLFSRGWLSPIHEEVAPSPSADPEGTTARVDGADSDDSEAASVPHEYISGVKPAQADALRAAGYGSASDVQAASHAELSEVVGSALAAQIKADVGDGDAPAGVDPEADGELDAGSAPEADRSGSAPGSSSPLGRDITTSGGRSDLRSAAGPDPGASSGDSDPEASPPETEPAPEADPDRVEGAESPAGSRLVSVSPDEFEALRSNPPEQPQSGAESIAGSDFEATLRAAKGSYGRRDDLLDVFEPNWGASDSAQSETRPEETVQERLTALRATLEESADGLADSRSDTDAWTADAAVRSFLNPQRQETLSLRYRIRVWLTPETTFERLVTRAIETLEDASDGSEDG